MRPESKHKRGSMKLKLTISLMLIATVVVTACGSANTPQGQEPTADVAAIRTSAASTVIAQFTLTAAVFTPTPSLPTATAGTPQTAAPTTPQQTATATQQSAQVTDASGTTIALCDLLSYDPATVDVNVPDNTTMTPGQDFIKTWRVKNNGSCPWDPDYELVYAGYSDQMSGQFQPLAEVVQPGQEVEL